MDRFGTWHSYCNQWYAQWSKQDFKHVVKAYELYSTSKSHEYRWMATFFNPAGHHRVSEGRKSPAFSIEKGKERTILVMLLLQRRLEYLCSGVASDNCSHTGVLICEMMILSMFRNIWMIFARSSQCNIRTYWFKMLKARFILFVFFFALLSWGYDALAGNTNESPECFPYFRKKWCSLESSSTRGFLLDAGSFDRIRNETGYQRDSLHSGTSRMFVDCLQLLFSYVAGMSQFFL